MKQTMMNTAAGVLAAVLLGSAGLAYANPYPVGSQQWHNFNGIMQSEADRIQRERNAVRQQPINRGPTAAEIRAWEQREAEVQARIARFRATPYWMALAWNFEKDAIIWPGGFRSEQRAIERAKQICSSPNCHVFATFNNTCAHFVSAVARPRSVQDFFVAYDRDGNRAVRKAVHACEAVHGKREDRCFSSLLRTPHGEGIFCVGYDYNLYNQR
ncbi:hypothetical protein A7Q01_06865 [Eikenella sp. NML96-A-049]|uniref:DUF4189 domain-containing protein n=1 Tax=unclassified Eikenella TaxID=2639367 RepID=UPI0007DF9791|nr:MULTISPECIES: DUF4189 domain-containing protein [unclassified Eikenella]OAM34411.1 hypothetical protein A7P97_04205 [Eikenella sp. NML070372]OAM39156.1 hypothetical protein A7Q01_06865 [Eikenella sp. NML96-A-049]